MITIIFKLLGVCMEFRHVPVLKERVIECLNIKKGGIYVDGTLGGGGHSLCILQDLNNTGKLIGIDRDVEAIKAAKERLKKYNNFIVIKDNNENIESILKSLKIDKVDGILLDLGVSSYQLDEASRGFSYMADASLDMRMNREDKLTAFEVINKYSEQKLTDIFFDYGEEKYSKSIAKKIVEQRKIKEIETTIELVEIIKSAIPKKALQDKGHPAKRVFQAVRIEVNGELIKLKETIISATKRLNIGGRIAVISFHSLEDRIIKKTFEDLQGRCTCPSDFPKCVCGYVSYGKIITKKPIVPSEEENSTNPRAKSSKLRVFERM